MQALVRGKRYIETEDRAFTKVRPEPLQPLQSPTTPTAHVNSAAMIGTVNGTAATKIVFKFDRRATNCTSPYWEVVY